MKKHKKKKGLKRVLDIDGEPVTVSKSEKTGKMHLGLDASGEPKLIGCFKDWIERNHPEILN